MEITFAQLGAVTLDGTTKVPVTQAVRPSMLPENATPIGNLPTYSALGVTALPYAATEGGYCEALIVENAGGLPGVIVGMRDLRAASIYGEAVGGDTIIHSTGPNLAAMLLLKEVRKQAVLRTKDTTNKDMIFGLDGAGDKVTISAFKCLFEMTRGRVRVGVQGATTNAMIELLDTGVININASQLNLNIGGTALGVPGAAANPAVVIQPATVPVPHPLINVSALPVMRALKRWLKKLLAELQLGVELARVTV